MEDKWCDFLLNEGRDWEAMNKTILKTCIISAVLGGVLLTEKGGEVKAEGITPQMNHTGVFKDVPKGHWAYEAIHQLTGEKIIFGYEDGRFGFGDNVTREQVAALMYRYFNVAENKNYQNPYGDVSEDSTSYIKEILSLTEMGVFTGDEHGNFRPKASLTRAEMAQVLTNAFHLKAKSDHTFNDVSTNSWARNAISAVQTNNIAKGVGGGKFAPSMDVTREQYAQFLYNAIQETKHTKQTKGQLLASILGETNWKGTKVYDKDHNDLTKENQNFIGLAKYDAKTARYEFFNANTGESRNDSGTFFITNDGKKRVLISETQNYQAVVELTQLDKEKFTYKRMGKDAKGNDVEVFVEHVPYHEKELSFTRPDKNLESSTGKIVTDVDGDEILSSTLWNGTVVLDEQGNNVTKYNSNLISLAKYDKNTNKYEFFNVNTGESRGDYGFFDVVHGNKIRAHVSLGNNKYGAVLELTELNKDKFTYTRIGKDANGKDIKIFVEHEPYTGDLKPNFTK
ncbi:S-layer protein [Bacillus cereus]|nr:S-layer protein [Bacillus cereus]PGS10720.1 S-layer protein [Bacillus cereus]